MPDLSPLQIELAKARPIGNLVPAELFPEGMFGASGSSILGSIYYTDYSVQYGDLFSGQGVAVTLDMLIPANVELSVPGLSHVALGIGEQGFIPFTARVSWTSTGFNLAIEDVALNLRFSRDLLEPAEALGGGTYRVIPGDERAQVSATGSVLVNSDFDIAVEGFDEFDLGPVKIPSVNSIYLLLEGVKLDLSRTTVLPEIAAAGFGPEFQGLYVRNLQVAFQDDLSFIPLISASNFAIGTGGISGTISATFDLRYDNGQLTGDAAGELFGNSGIQIGLRKFELELRANEVVRSAITGQMVLPFFEQPVEIELSFDLKGNFAVGLKAVAGGVLAELTKEDLLSMKLRSFSFSRVDGEIAFSLGGSIKLLAGDVKWPEFGVNDLGLTRLSNGRWEVVVRGGWIDFAEPLRFEIGAFKGELRKVAWGALDEAGDRRFLGFSGSVGFVSQFALAAEFDDLRLIYPSPIDVTLERARIGLVIPDAVAFIGEVSKRGQGFGGSLDLTIIPIELRVLGGAEFGSATDSAGSFSYMQILLGLELPPPGIVLGSTPLAIRGGEMKFAMAMRPSMDPGWEWAVTPPKGIMHLSKMVPERDGRMFAAGLKITTTDGTLLAANVLLALILPGPVVMIEGRGAVLTKVFGEGDPGDPPFYKLMVINGKEKYVSSNLAINANLAKGVVKVSGTIGAFFDLEDSDNWYIQLGQKTPRSKRIEAIAYKVLRGTSYFEASAGPHLVFGGDFGIKGKVNFKVGHAKIDIRIGGEADLSWKPQHAAGMLDFHANIAIRACGFGAQMNAHGTLAAKSPYARYLYVAAGYRFSFNLPTPLPDVSGHGEIEKTWKDGSRITSFSQLVSEVRVDAEMPGIPATTLTRYATLAEHPAAVTAVPVVSLDARPTIQFSYPMNDDTPLRLAGNASNGQIMHRIGDDEFRFAVTSVRLQSRAIPVDQSLFDGFGTEEGWTTVSIPYGVWVADNSITGHSAAMTLRLFSNTPFTQFRQSGFQGRLATGLGLEFSSRDAGWLGSMADGDVLFGETQFLDLTEAAAASPAADLAARVEEQTPGYPFGLAASEWKYLGFADVPMAFGLQQQELTRTVAVRAVADASGAVRPFDVVDLHFLPPDELMPELRTVATLVRGVYFEGAIKVDFSVPVSECVLFLYPVKGRAASGWLPDDLSGKKPERPLDHATVIKLKGVLTELQRLLPEQAARRAIEDMIEQLEECYANTKAGKDGATCCTELKNIWSRLVASTKGGTGGKGKAYLKQLQALLAKACPNTWTAQSPPKDGVFLRFDLSAKASSDAKRNPVIIARRGRPDGEEEPVGTSEERDTPGDLYRIRIAKDDEPFDSVAIEEPGATTDQGWFLIAIGYLVDEEERHDVIADKTLEMIDVAWRGEPDTDGSDTGDGPAEVVLSPRSCYRLAVETTVDGSAPETNYYYFRTDGPPASYLKEYVAWPVPGAGSYPHFRDYDIALRFRTNYADKLFESLPLEIRLQSSSGTSLDHALGEHLAWEDEQTHLLRPEEQVYIDVLNAEGTVSIDPGAIPGDKSLALGGGAGGAGSLESDQEYRVALALAPGSGLALAKFPLGAAFYYVPQEIPVLLTPQLNGAVHLGGYRPSGQPEGSGTGNPQLTEDPELYTFTFRTSRYRSFAELFGPWTSGDAVPVALQLANDATLNAALSSLHTVSQTIWRPAQVALREKELQVRQRLATEEELLGLLDSKAAINAQLDEAVDLVLAELGNAPGALDPPPNDPEIYFSPRCILVRLPEPIEFARVSASYPGFDVLFACSADERTWLISPGSAAESFARGGVLSFGYHLDIGPHLPRQGYGGLVSEAAAIVL